MDKEDKSSQGLPIWNFALGGLCGAYGAFGYLKAKNKHIFVRFVSFGALYATSSALLYSGHFSSGYATGILPSVIILGVFGSRAIFYAGWQAPAIAIIGAMGTFHNGKKLYESLEKK